MSNVTIFPKFELPKQPFIRPISKVLQRIKDGKSKVLIDKIRITGNKELKNDLPAICFSGEFTYRNAKSITKHSGFICLDFDKFPDSDTLLMWKDTLEGDKYTYCVFLSPGGYGLKCLVKIPPIINNHRKYFDALKDHYNTEYFDIHCSDVCRICYESYDPYLTINEQSEVWTLAKEYEPVNTVYGQADLNQEQTANNLLKWWHRKYGLYQGGRNHNVFKLCAAFNDYGINRDYAYSIVAGFQEEDFKLTEIEVILKSAYKKVEKFGTLKF